jgi:hypothetical protein
MACLRRGCCLLCVSYTTKCFRYSWSVFIFLLKCQHFCSFFCAHSIYNFYQQHKHLNLCMPCCLVPTIVGFVSIIFIPKASFRIKNVHANGKVRLFQIKDKERNHQSQLRDFSICIREICLQHVLVQRGLLRVTHVSKLLRRVTGL